MVLKTIEASDRLRGFESHTLRAVMSRDIVNRCLGTLCALRVLCRSRRRSVLLAGGSDRGTGAGGHRAVVADRVLSGGVVAGSPGWGQG